MTAKNIHFSITLIFFNFLLIPDRANREKKTSLGIPISQTSDSFWLTSLKTSNSTSFLQSHDVLDLALGVKNSLLMAVWRRWTCILVSCKQIFNYNEENNQEHTNVVFFHSFMSSSFRKSFKQLKMTTLVSLEDIVLTFEF